MKNTEQTLLTAIGELNCVRSDSPAALDELRALSIARECVDALMDSCINQMRTDPVARQSWANIAHALGSDSPSAVRQRFGYVPASPDEQIAAFWEACALQFTWDFLPSEFLYQLYVNWMHRETCESEPLSRETFTRRLKGVATASGDWVHSRSRPLAHMRTKEPLLAWIPQWSAPETNRALYGLRRSCI